MGMVCNKCTKIKKGNRKKGKINTFTYFYLRQTPIKYKFEWNNKTSKSRRT